MRIADTGANGDRLLEIAASEQPLTPRERAERARLAGALIDPAQRVSRIIDRAGG